MKISETPKLTFLKMKGIHEYMNIDIFTLIKSFLFAGLAIQPGILVNQVCVKRPESKERGIEVVHCAGCPSHRDLVTEIETSALH